MVRIIIISFLIITCNTILAQSGYILSGRVTEADTLKSIAYATIHLKKSDFSTLSKTDGSFRIYTTDWYDSIEVTSVGYATITLALQKDKTTDLKIVMQRKQEMLQTVVVSISKHPGKAFMQKVIEQKEQNNPSRFGSYSYHRYTRNELDIDNIDFQKIKGKGYKSLLLKTYESLDSSAKDDKELPIYFHEVLANVYHSVSPKIEQENIMAQKNLGLKTDEVLSKLDKFHFHFNVYNDWLPIFNQTYVSPLNTTAFNYYDFFEEDSTVVDGQPIQQIRFAPKRAYERAFSGELWINKNTLAVETIVMRLSKTANINFIQDLRYSEDYSSVYDSATNKTVNMPYKYYSEVKFESGLDLLGIPVPENQNSVKFVLKNTTVHADVDINVSGTSVVIGNLVRKEKTTNWDKSNEFWQQNRPEQLTDHEKNIYTMVDSLKQNNRFMRDAKLLAFAGSGAWEFGKYVGVGAYTTFLSNNPIEGWRFRVGFWTMPGISKKASLFGYGAYGTKDRKIKGTVGIKYVWNAAKWTKSTLSYGSDYDFILDQDDELDKDNIVNTILRKNIPFSRTYVKQVLLKHDQYISSNFSARGSVRYRELNPVFDFQYRPINPDLDKPYDSVFAKVLPVAAATIGIRYAHNENSVIINYDKINKTTFSPILYANYTYGLEIGKAQFEFQKINVGIEHRLRLPPKSVFYYKLEGGKVYGTIPYLLLNIPAGNEYYVASRYVFNTMSPYEFASDRYVNLHTRLYLGGVLMDKIPFIRKLGWRERFSFNSYWGDMSQANIDYNKGSNFNLLGKQPFMEAGIGIENIFHILSIEYYRRLNYLNHPYARRDGLYLGITLML